MAIEQITFPELVHKMYSEKHGNRPEYRIEGVSYHFSQTRVVEDGPLIPVLATNFTPPWFDRIRTGILYFEVNGVNYMMRRSLDTHEAHGYAVGIFEVYNFDVNKLDDPNVTDDLQEIHASQVLVPSDIDGARIIGSWVADSGLRSRINEFFEATRTDEGRLRVDKLMRLRKAPFEKSNYPSVGKYTYQGVVKAAAQEERGYGRPFTEEDVEWLQTFMRNKGVPIPEIE